MWSPQAHSCTQTDCERALKHSDEINSTAGVWMLKGEGCAGAPQKRLCLCGRRMCPSGGYLARVHRCSFISAIDKVLCQGKV